MKTRNEIKQQQLSNLYASKLSKLSTRDSELYKNTPREQMTSAAFLQLEILKLEIEICDKNRSTDEQFHRAENFKTNFGLGICSILIGVVFAGLFTHNETLGAYSTWGGFGIGVTLTWVLIGLANLVYSFRQMRRDLVAFDRLRERQISDDIAAGERY